MNKMKKVVFIIVLERFLYKKEKNMLPKYKNKQQELKKINLKAGAKVFEDIISIKRKNDNMKNENK